MRPPIRLDLGPYAAGSLQLSLGGQFDSVEGLRAQSTELVLRLVEEGLKSYANSFKPDVVYGECRHFRGAIQQTDNTFVSLRLTINMCHSRDGGLQLPDFLDFVLTQSIAGVYRLLRRVRATRIIDSPDEFRSYCDYLATMLIHEPEDELDISELLEVSTPDSTP